MMVVPTVVGPSGTVMVGDVLVWKLPADAPQPYPGATIRGEGYDEDGQLCRAWTAVATRPEVGLQPVPYVYRGMVLVDATGAGTTAEPLA